MICLDVVGLEIFVTDRVWLLRENRDGFVRVCAGTVEAVDDDGWVRWSADPMTESEWAMFCEGCDVTSHGMYAAPSRHGTYGRSGRLTAGEYRDHASTMKVVRRGTASP